MRRSNLIGLVVCLVATGGTAGCVSGNGGSPTGTGGAIDAGTGGAPGAGGRVDAGAGGSTGTGGATGSGGATGAGGTSGAAGAVGTGGAGGTACVQTGDINACGDPLPPLASGDAGPSCPRALTTHGTVAANRTCWSTSATACSNHPEFPAVNPPIQAIDPSVDTRYSTGLSQNDGTYALTIDFKAAIRIDGIQLNYGTDLGDYARTYEVDVSADNATWQAAACGTAAAAVQITDIGFTAVTARYLRVFAIQTPLNGGTSWWSVHDLNVYVAAAVSDGGPGADGSVDAAGDTGADGSVDAAGDAGPDRPVDATGDASADGSVDAAGDAGVD